MLKISALALISPPRVCGRSVVSLAAENKHHDVGQARATTTCLKALTDGTIQFNRKRDAGAFSDACPEERTLWSRHSRDYDDCVIYRLRRAVRRCAAVAHTEMQRNGAAIWFRT